ncbi:coniferyl aldehyde dehydrogenase [Pelomonas sp. SE-A7]|uniref:coniferyl aldehyde dehydrogenase n=1 Tax=Pelomonas sp. SE-A7 TaxID=3054953 RepID=UPI00259CEB3A|nr:coniferyl aldehyde dehydrogenase [Pelomonas sp. SE-A7]MDM4765048.1 coniferyl aldehyde dehydrogenase [Pelomonas sp. SE-A7]
MNSHDTPYQDLAEIERLQLLLARQQAACAALPFPDLAWRAQRLRALIAALRRHQDALVAAVDADFGGRSHSETKLIEVMGPILEARHALAKLRRWMRPKRRHTEFLFLGNNARVEYQPKGVVGIIGTWNFPVYLTLGPLVAALAAGNRALIKGSEYAPQTLLALRKLLAEVFTEDEVAVVGGGPETARAFTALPLNHLVFTGSPAVGRQVMRAAAEHLVPVTLELGGKSPALVAPGADLADAALRIVHGKVFNAGQICVAPDYALVPRGQALAFASAAKAAFARLAPQVGGNGEYTAIITERHAARLNHLVSDALAQGARVLSCGVEAGPDKRMALQLLLDTKPEMAVMREEIFGPLLPIVEYDSLDEALALIREGERPLSLYAFGFDGAGRRRLLRESHAGGVTFDDWGWHVFQHDLPFGGVGNSGMGSYHGEEGFRELSHAKAVFTKRRWFPIGLFYPPYGNIVQRLAMKLYL